MNKLMITQLLKSKRNRKSSWNLNYFVGETNDFVENNGYRHQDNAWKLRVKIII